MKLQEKLRCLLKTKALLDFNSLTQLFIHRHLFQNISGLVFTGHLAYQALSQCADVPFGPTQQSPINGQSMAVGRDTDVQCLFIYLFLSDLYQTRKSLEIKSSSRETWPRQHTSYHSNKNKTITNGKFNHQIYKEKTATSSKEAETWL